jgi:hypothetical protein
MSQYFFGTYYYLPHDPNPAKKLKNAMDPEFDIQDETETGMVVESELEIKFVVGSWRM